MQISSKWMARFILLAFFCFLFFCGAGVGYIGLNDTDTCWLLAMGRWIVDHGTLPFVDPFSSGVQGYATVLLGKPLAQYQWLAEIIFYCIYKLNGLTGLLILISAIIYTTYVALPFLVFQKAGVPRIVSFLLICVQQILVSFRWLVRPQVFSFLFLSALIFLFIPSSKTGRTSFYKVLAISIIMLLWANTHIYFPIGIIFILIATLGILWDKLIIERRSLSFCLPLFLIPPASFLATCINPWGYGLWIYVYRLWTAPNNYLLQEIDPFNVFELSDRNSILLLSLVAIYIFYYWLFRILSIRQSGILSPTLFIAGLYAGLKHAVFLPVSSLFIIGGLAELIKRQDIFSKQIKPGIINDWTVWWKTTDNYLQALIPKKRIWLTSLLIIMTSGTIVYAALFPPTLPHSNSSFEPPFEAINFLKQSRPAGKVFNDPLFGSMMTWYLPKPDVFYDSRFSQYEPERMLEYLHINNCDLGYEKLWQKYDFDWVFIRSSAPLASALKKIGWETIYSDKIASIMIKPKN